MAEDFLGYGGRLDEEFVHAENKSIKTEPFEKFEVRAAFEKPELLDGLVRLKTAMGEAAFEKYINPLENINISGSSLLILAGAEKLRTALVSRWLPVIKAASNRPQRKEQGSQETLLFLLRLYINKKWRKANEKIFTFSNDDSDGNYGFRVCGKSFQRCTGGALGL